MIYLKQNTILIKQNQEELISKLKWKIHLVENPYFARTTSLRDKTNRPFAGNINEVDGSFYLKRIRPFLNYYLPVFLVKGEIIKDREVTKLRLRYQLGILSTIFLLYLLFGLFLFLWGIIVSGFENIEGLGWFLIPLLFIWLGNLEIKKVEENLFEIFEI